MSLIEVVDVTKQFSNHLALDKVSLSIDRGTVFGLLGPNGAGKTTLIRILNQITAPDSGKVLFDGRDMNRGDIARIGYLPEERGLYKKMSVGEQALYLAQLKGVSKKEATKRLCQWFEKFDIGSWWNRKVEELSKGMQQKVQFITTIIHEPDFLIFDEPFSGFDPINANLLKNEILELKQKGATIILSTHNMGSVEEICDEIALINNSKKILEGNLFDLKKEFRKNLFEVEMSDVNAKILLEMPETFKVISTEQKGDTKSYNIEIRDKSASANDLLQYLMNYAILISFKEILPSMSDIFIQQVNRYNSSQHE